SAFEMSLACGGKIDDTRTRLNCAMPAARSAISKLDSFSRCLPTPAVRKIFFVAKWLLIVGGASERLKRTRPPHKGGRAHAAAARVANPHAVITAARGRPGTRHGPRAAPGAAPPIRR